MKPRNEAGKPKGTLEIQVLNLAYQTDFWNQNIIDFVHLTLTTTKFHFK